MRIFICGSVRTSGRFTTCCQKVPPAPRFGRRVPPQTQAAKLHIAAAHDHRRAGTESALLRCRIGHRAERSAGLFDRREQIRTQPGHIEQRRAPVAAEQVEHSGGTGVGWVDGQLAGEFCRQPVANHGDGGSLTVNIRAMVRQPQQARHGA
jgi:hypothetical protein